MKLNTGAIIYGGELEEQDPYATRKRLFDQTMILDSAKELEEKKKKKESSEDVLKKFIENKRKEYGG